MGCEHEWVPSVRVLLTDPPQRDLICRHCLEEKREWLVQPADAEYDRLKQLKRERQMAEQERHRKGVEL